MSKSPYEIRSEVLAMAKEYMDQSYRMNLEYTQRMYENGKKTLEEMKAALVPYSMDDLMEKANKMYSFVQDKGSK